MLKRIAIPAILATLIFTTTFAFYFLPLDRPFATRGEGREALVVQAMVEQGNYILPLRGGVDIPSKPPMFHWIAILGSKLAAAEGLHTFGVEQTIRFPSPFLAALLLSSFFVFLSLFKNSKQQNRQYKSGTLEPPSEVLQEGLDLGVPSVRRGDSLPVRLAPQQARHTQVHTPLPNFLSLPLMATLMAAVSFEFFINTSHARVDMCFTFWVLTSLFCLFAVVEDCCQEGKHVLWKYILCGIVLSGAVLSKGPAGLLIPLIIIGAYIILVRKSLKSMPFAYIAISVLISLLIAGTWYYLAYLQQGDEFLFKHLIKENFARLGFAGSLLTETEANNLPSVGHGGAAYLSILFPLVGFLPWSIFLPLIFVWLWYEKRKLLQPENKLVLFSMLIIGAFIAIIAVSASKRMVYLLPIYLPLSYLLAECILRLENSEISFGAIKTCVGFVKYFVLVLLIISVAVMSVFLVLEFDGTLLERMLSSETAKKANIQVGILAIQEILGDTSSAMTCFFLRLIAVLALLMAYLRLNWACDNIAKLTANLKRAILNIGMFIIAFYVIGNYYVMPTAAKITSPKEFAEKVLAESEEHCKEFVSYNIDLYTMAFYMNKPVKSVISMSELQQLAQDSNENLQICVLAPEKHFNVFENDTQAEFKLISQTFAANGKGKLALIYLRR